MPLHRRLRGVTLRAVRFHDRRDAGRQLTTVVAGLDLVRPVVLALPRGGVPVGAEVARALQAALDVIVARKVGAPGQRELGIAAVAEGGALVVVRSSVARLGVSEQDLARRVHVEREELARRVQRYRGDRPLPDLAGRDVVLVDDGLATGVTAEAALAGIRTLSPRAVWVAVPVAAGDTRRRLATQCDGIVAVAEPEPFFSVGQFYEDFDQTTDAEVVALLADALGGR